jgi:hypothetical protein
MTREQQIEAARLEIQQLRQTLEQMPTVPVTDAGREYRRQCAQDLRRAEMLYDELTRGVTA